MNKSKFSAATAAIVVSIATTFAFAAPPAQRHFQPTPTSASQRIDNIEGLVVISSAGKQAHVGTAIRPLSAKQSALMVSVKNTGATPIEFHLADIKVVSDGKALSILAAESTSDGPNNDKLVRDRCANAIATTTPSDSAQSAKYARANATNNCNIDQFNEQQRKRVENVSPAWQVAAGQVLAQQFRLDLPKKVKGATTKLSVTVTIQGEAQSFDFWEVE